MLDLCSRQHRFEESARTEVAYILKADHEITLRHAWYATLLRFGEEIAGMGFQLAARGAADGG